MSRAAFDRKNLPPVIPRSGDQTFTFEIDPTMRCSVEFALEGVVIRHLTTSGSILSVRYVPWEEVERMPAWRPVVLKPGTPIA